MTELENVKEILASLERESKFFAKIETTPSRHKAWLFREHDQDVHFPIEISFDDPGGDHGIEGSTAHICFYLASDAGYTFDDNNVQVDTNTAPITYNVTLSNDRSVLILTINWIAGSESASGSTESDEFDFQLSCRMNTDLTDTVYYSQDPKIKVGGPH